MSEPLHLRAPVIERPCGLAEVRAKAMLDRFQELTPVEQYQALLEIGGSDPLAAAALYVSALPRLDPIPAMWGIRLGNSLGVLALLVFCEQHENTIALTYMDRLVAERIERSDATNPQNRTGSSSSATKREP
jgi:hypothetical protein